MSLVKFQESVEFGRGAVPAGRKIAISFLVLLIVAAMLLWFGFLGWGAVEIARSALVVLKSIWV